MIPRLAIFTTQSTIIPPSRVPRNGLTQSHVHVITLFEICLFEIDPFFSKLLRVR